MDLPTLILLMSFFVMLLLNVPIGICIGLSTLLALVALGDVPSAFISTQRLSTGIGRFPLLAIPFFILSGVIMGEGGMARRLMDFANALVGRFKGGLAYVNTLTCMMFGAISGSAAAAVSSIGSFIIPEMDRKGYGRNFSVALTTTSATTGLLIPPSNVMIVYAVVAGNVSIAALFLAGVVPGLIIGVLLMVVSYFMRGRGPGAAVTEAEALPPLLPSFLKALPSLLLVFIVLGGILGGIFSATEASAVAVAYAVLLSVVFYREVKFSRIPKIILQAAKTNAVVMLLVGTSQAMSWVLTYEQVPQDVSAALLGISENPIVILLIINVMLLIVGTFMDMTAAVLIFTPILLPVVMNLGMNPVHFGILMIANLCIGLCTPPVGTCLFVGCGVGKTTIARVIPQLMPLFVAMLIGLLLISYVPGLSLWFPSLFGF